MKDLQKCPLVWFDSTEYYTLQVGYILCMLACNKSITNKYFLIFRDYSKSKPNVFHLFTE